MHIAIAGNIGSGKTTLTKMLAARYGWTPNSSLWTSILICLIFMKI